jgi:23S rRNA (cytidine1920-2'-O)/16S rRNA (cytidine1409-2'-O)-methyltransferase
VRGKEHPWVSRGGIKLAHGLDQFGWDVTGAVGWTWALDRRLHRRAAAARGGEGVRVDVGTNQLAWKLRQDRA